MQHLSSDSGDLDDEVQCVNADGSPYGRGTGGATNHPINPLLKPRFGEYRSPPSNATPISIPGNPPRNRPPNVLKSLHGPSETPSYTLTDTLSTRNTRNSGIVNGSSNNGSKGWGAMKSLDELPMRGIKAPRGRVSKTPPSVKVGLDEQGKFHIPIQDVSVEKKRQRDVINVDDDDITSFKKPRRERAERTALDTTTSPHFSSSRLDNFPPPMKSSPLDKEAGRRGLPVQMEDPFSKAYNKSSSTFADEIAEEMKSATQRIRFPGQGNNNKRRELVQNNTSRSTETGNTGNLAPVEFHLSWLMLLKQHTDVLAKLYIDRIEFFSVQGDRIIGKTIRAVKSVKCTEDGKMWVLIDQDGANLIFSIKDREMPKASVALEQAYGGIIDQVEHHLFTSRFLTESDKRQELTIPRQQPMVLITDRGKNVPSKLHFLNQPPEHQRKGPLEQPSPKAEVNTKTARQESNPRRDLVTRPRDRGNDEKSEKPTRPQATLAPPRRETRSQSAITKNIPLLQYPPNATKNKVIIYPDDINRLADEEFLNDTIIEFYLLYILDHLPAATREKTHFFNSFFWTNLNRKNAAGKRGHENVKKWTSKVDLFSKEFVVIPVNEAAHWYVAIICNLDKAKQRKEVPTPKPPRTRSQIDETSLLPTTEDIDLAAEDQMDLSTPTIVLDEISEDNEIILDSQPRSSRQETLDMAIDSEDRMVEVIGIESDPVIPEPPIPEPEEPATQPDPVAEPGTESVATPMDVDAPEQIAKDLRRMSISSNPELEMTKYDFQDDPSIDEDTRKAIEKASAPEIIRYSRRKSSARKQDPITLEEGGPTSITSLMKKKYHQSATAKPAPRRTSNKIIPPDTPVIIVFDSLGLRHVPTIKALRDYLVEEAKSKRGMDLAKDDIVGMHAKVPKQSNYCDCGVFLLHYVEKFLGEPERYLPDILGRAYDTSEPELTYELWRSGEVQEKRAQIRQLIFDLSDDYKREKEKKGDDKKALEEKENEKEKGNEQGKGSEKEEKVEKRAEEVIPPKPTETPTQSITETTKPSDPPVKRRKQHNPTRLVASDSKVIELIE